MNVVHEILRSRGVASREEREAFLSPSYEAGKHDPFLLPDMDKAVKRLVLAQKKREKVVIYGDYDIDGLTASTVLLESFTAFGLTASVFIPNRFVEGYGLSGVAIRKLAAEGAQLIVTVDCGSLSHKEIELANSLGVEVIVTDHHSVAETMPPAVAVINPKRLLQDFPEAYEGFLLKLDFTIDSSGAIVSEPFVRATSPASSRHGDPMAQSLLSAELPADKQRVKQSSTSSDRAIVSSGLRRGVVARTKDPLYPFVDLAGVGVAFKLVQALQTRLEGLPVGHEKWLLDLVALGTVCDVVQLRGENRANVYWGLKVMQKTRRVGLKMLMAVARIEPDKLNARSLGFALGPRLNAAGRLETAQLALDLLTATDRKEALRLAEQLDAMNVERRAEQDRIYKAASEQALSYEQDRVLVVSHESWSHGIIGIVAAKLLEKHHKPTFVLQELEDGIAKGSARSFGDFSAVEGIRATDHLLTKGGGHKLAAGVTLEINKIAEWRTAINVFYGSLKLENQERFFAPKADVELEDFSSLNEKLLDELAKLEPYGNGNPEPVFCIQHATVIGRRTMGADAQHVKYRLSDTNGVSFEMIAFNKAHEFEYEIGEMVSAWFELTLNEWQGRRSIEGKLLRLEMDFDDELGVAPL